MSHPGPAADPKAPYVRAAVVGLIRREDGGRGASSGAGTRRGATGDGAEPQWLLIHRTVPFEAWDPPGGRMEDGEDLVQAVTREVREESALIVDVAGPCYALLTYYQGERLLAVSMACRPQGDPDEIVLEPGGDDAWRWVTTGEWLELAKDRQTTWNVKDITKATGAVAAVWEAAEA